VNSLSSPTFSIRVERTVRKICFEGWQATEGGKREVCKALRRTLAKYKLHKDKELFEKALGM
jgi:type I restriction enzyme, R subunit